jgi:Immunity protein 49
MGLKDEGEPLAYEIAFDLADELPSLGELEVRAGRTAAKLRALAVIVLLTRGDTARFHGNLRAAAEIWRDYLVAAAQAPTLVEAGRLFAAGRCEGLFDALAAGDLALAREIAAALPRDWRRHVEYEDDFCWLRSLAVILLGRPLSGNDGPALLERFESSLQGQPSSRLGIAQALMHRDGAGFGYAFLALLAEHQATLAERIEAGELEDTLALTERCLFIEGLAVLALAGACGLASEREYLCCPAIARVVLPQV